MTLNSNLIGNLKHLLDKTYPDRAQADSVLNTLAWLIHQHEGDITRHELEALLLGKADGFHVHEAMEITELAEELAKLSDVDHHHEDVYLRVEVDSIFAQLLEELNATIGLKIDLVGELPEEAKEGRFYLVPKTEEGEINSYDEYLYYEGEFEKIDTDLTPLDVLEQYATVVWATKQLQELATIEHTHDNYALREWFEKEITPKAFNTLANTLENGLMSHQDKAKLDGIENEANQIIVEDQWITNSQNVVTNRLITSELNQLKGEITSQKNRLIAIQEALND